MINKNDVVAAQQSFSSFTLSRSFGLLKTIEKNPKYSGCLISLLCLAKGKEIRSYDEAAETLQLPRSYIIGFVHGFIYKEAPKPRYPGHYDQGCLDGFTYAKGIFQ